MAGVPSGGVYESVDLGLPSGTLWAKYNIGASKESEYGDLFAWGATLPYRINGKKSLDRTENYSKCFASTIDKNLSELCDPVTVLWGKGWMTPSKEQFTELIENCSSEWSLVDGINGVKFISNSNQQYVFFPAAGCINGSDVHSQGVDGRIWTSTLHDISGAIQLRFNNREIILERYARYCGLSFRPVRIK